MIIEIDLVNDDGMGYGIMPIVVCETFAQGSEELLARYGPEMVYGIHPITHQFRSRYLVKYDPDGNLQHENDDWLAVISEFLGKGIGFEELRRIHKILT